MIFLLKKWFKEYIEINKSEIITVISLLIIGVVVGIVAYAFSTDTVKELSVSSVKSVLDISKEETYVKTNVILNGIKADIILILILAIFSVTLFGRWGIYLILLLKGAAISVYTILLFKVFGPLWGIVTILLLVVLVNVLYIPALIYLAVTFLEINFNIFKAKFSNINMGSIYKVIVVVIISFIVMFSSIVVEQVVSSIVLNIYTKI